MADIKNYNLEYTEGELYETLEVEGYKFEIYCGYHTEQDRKANLVLPIYPNFITNPKYTKKGHPLVTCMQNSCIYYDVIPGSDIELKFLDCKFFENKNREVIGVCKCKERIKNRF